MDKGNDCTRFVVGHMSPTEKRRFPSQFTEAIGKTVMI